MMTKKRGLCALGIWVLAAGSASAQARHAVNTLVLDYPTRTVCWIEKPKSAPATIQATTQALSDQDKPGCPAGHEWTSGDYFLTGDVVRLLVVNYRMLSRFTVEVNGVEIAPEIPEPRGMTSVDVAASAAKGATSADVAKGVSVDVEAAYRAARSALDLALQKLDLLLGKTTTDVSAPGSTMSRMHAFTDALKTDAAAAWKKSPSKFTDTAAFVSLLDRADALTNGVQGLNARIKDAFDSVTAARSAAGLFVGAAPGDARRKTIDDDLSALQTKENQVASEIGLLNVAMVEALDTINALYRVSAEQRPFELTIGQFSGGRIVSFTVTEAKGFVPYVFVAVGIPVAAVAKSGPVTAASATLAKATEDKADETPKPKEAPKPAPFYTGGFEVHQVFRANIASGFIVSALRNREYGIQQVQATDETGQPVFKDHVPVYNKVAVVGEAKRPQFHYFVGVDLYFRNEDFFPGSRAAVIPSILVGYGINEPLNFFVGPNFETKLGLNIGFGWHFGRETFLAPGIIPGPDGTVLPSDAKDPPTVKRFASNRFKDSYYINIGFDYRTFKSVFGGLVGLK
jgi:hypothetical protein